MLKIITLYKIIYTKSRKQKTSELLIVAVIAGQTGAEWSTFD